MREPGVGGGEQDFVRVGPFTFDERTMELFRGGQPVQLQPKPTLVLAELVAARGRLVERSRLYEVGWGDTVVEFDLALNRCVKDIRAAVGDDAKTQWFLATVPRRGYRLVPNVEAIQASDARRVGRRHVLAALAATVLLLVAPVAHFAFHAPSPDPDVTILNFQSFGTEVSGLDRAIQEDVHRRLGLGTGSPESTGLLVNGVIVPAPDGAVLEVTLVRLADGQPIWNGRYNPLCERISGDATTLIGGLISREVRRRS